MWDRFGEWPLYVRVVAFIVGIPLLAPFAAVALLLGILGGAALIVLGIGLTLVSIWWAESTGFAWYGIAAVVIAVSLGVLTIPAAFAIEEKLGE